MSKARTVRLQKGVTITLRGDVWHLTLVRSNRRIRRSLETRDEELARAMAEEWADRLFGPQEPRFDSFRSFSDQWLKKQARILQPSTVARYRAGIKEACRSLGSRPLASVTKADAARLAESMRLDGKGRIRAHGTLRNLLAGLRCMYEDARLDGLASENPFDQLGRILRNVAPKGAREDETENSAIAYTRDEQKRLLAAIDDPQDRVAVMLGMRAGLRRSEILALLWTDLDLEGRYVQVRRRWSRGALGAPKSKTSRRTVPLSKSVVRALRSLRVAQQERSLAAGRETPAAVFPARTRHAPTTEFQQEDRFSGRFLKALKRADVERRTVNPFHRLRHTFASELLTNGVPIFKVSKWLGHSSSDLTYAVYGHLIPKPDEHQSLDQLDDPAPRSASRMPHRK